MSTIPLTASYTIVRGLLVPLLLTANGFCGESRVDDLQKRAERFTGDTKDSRVETLAKNSQTVMQAIETSGKTLIAAYGALDLDTCLNPGTATPEQLKKAGPGVAAFRDAAQAFGAATVQHRRHVVAELDRQKLAVAGTPRAEADSGFDLALKWAEGGLRLADTAVSALKSFKTETPADPQHSKNVLAAAESYEAAYDALAAHRDRRQKRMDQILPR